jgi:hypothetical protein
MVVDNLQQKSINYKSNNYSGVTSGKNVIYQKLPPLH